MSVMHRTKFLLEKYYSLYELLRTWKLNMFSKGVFLFEQIILNLSVCVCVRAPA